MTTTPAWGHIREGDCPTFTQHEDGRTAPVYELNGQWGFADEKWADSFGPFESREEAEKVLKEMASMMDFRKR